MGKPILKLNQALIPLRAWIDYASKATFFYISSWSPLWYWLGYVLGDVQSPLRVLPYPLSSILSGCSPSHNNNMDSRS